MQKSLAKHLIINAVSKSHDAIARSRPFCQESRYSCSPLARCPYVTGSKKSVPHYGSGEIINDRCTNPTPRALLRYLKTESRRMIALRFCTLVSPRWGLDSIRHAEQLEYVHCRRMIGCNSLIPRSKLTRWSAYALNPCSLFRWEWRQFFSRCWPCACCSWVCRPAAG